MRRLIRFGFLLGVKLISLIFYQTKVSWVGGKKPDSDPWKDVRLLIFLKHTSLFEPLFISAFPNRFIWEGVERSIIPGADKTLNRPITGRFYRVLSPKMVSITRKKDRTWEDFLQEISHRSLVIIAPEGRMMRANGLDAQGNPMNVRGGVSDILNLIEDGKMLIAYSGGLHHVQVPGQRFPNLFRTIKICFEHLDIPSFKKEIQERYDTKEKKPGFKIGVVRELEKRMKDHCP